jgi:hypothetical protein
VKRISRKALRLAFAESAEIGSFSYVAAGGFRGSQLYPRELLPLAERLDHSWTTYRCSLRLECSLFWKKVTHGSVFNATPRQLLSQRDEFRSVWAESERPINLDPCRGMVPLTDERFGQQEVGGRFLALLL